MDLFYKLLRMFDDIGGYGNMTLSIIFAGALSGVLSWAVTNPIGLNDTLNLVPYYYSARN